MGFEHRNAASLAAEDDDHGLGPCDVHVWLAWLRADAPGSTTPGPSSTPEERARAERLRRPADRVAVRLDAGPPPAPARCLRRRSARGVDVHDDGLDGKPELAGENAPQSLHFNVSHSGALAAIAVGRRPVGVDVERIRADLPWPRIAAEFFSPSEVGALEHVAPPDGRRAFFDCWVRKEAYLKAVGVGLRRPTTTLHGSGARSRR